MRTKEINSPGTVVGIVTSNADKFEKNVTLAQEYGILTQLNRIALSYYPEELVSREAMEVGLHKLGAASDELNAEGTLIDLFTRGLLPDYIMIMDVLAMADLDNLSDEEAVMKKPHDGQTAMEAFTGFFIKCLDEMDRVDDERPNRLEWLNIKYKVLQAIAPVNQLSKKIEMDNARVEWDKITFTFSHALVELLANPKRVQTLAENGNSLNNLLGKDAVVGFRIATLLPMLLDLAVMNDNDDLWMMVTYCDNITFIDVKDDLTGPDSMIDTDCEAKETKSKYMPLLRFLSFAVKNVTPDLLKKMFLKPKSKVNH